MGGEGGDSLQLLNGKSGLGEGDSLQLKNGKSGWGTYTLYI